MRLFLRLLLPVMIGLTSCSEAGNGAGMISQRIGEATRNPEAKELDLSKLTSFGWQYMFYFPTGTSREEICKFINANRNSCGRVIRYLQVPPGHVALFFGQGGQLTHTELHDIKNGEFDFAIGDTGLPKERAVFKIRRAAVGVEGDRILLELK